MGELRVVSWKNCQVLELTKKRKCPKILQQEAEEHRAVRQCRREWQRTGDLSDNQDTTSDAADAADGFKASVLSEASTEVESEDGDGEMEQTGIQVKSKWFSEFLAQKAL